MNRHILLRVAVFLLGLTAAACGPAGPEPIQFGTDQCAYCRMTIADPNYGAELITDKGRVLKYDAAECLIDHLNDGAPPHRALYAVAYDTPGELHPVDSLAFVIASEFRSPMGANLAAFAERGAIPAPLRAEALGWDQTLQMREK